MSSFILPTGGPAPSGDLQQDLAEDRKDHRTQQRNGRHVHRRERATPGPRLLLLLLLLMLLLLLYPATAAATTTGGGGPLD